MSVFDGLMPRLVSFLAIRSWRDLIWKSAGFFLFFNILGLPIDYVSYAPEDRPRPFSDFWVITIISTPVLALQFSVVTYLDRLHRKLARLAMTDVLTELPNRRAFIERTIAIRAENPDGTMCILDADHFKRINDTYGHATGDACLQAIAEKLQKCTAPGDVLGRLGGEEFGAYLPNATPARVRQFGAQLTQQIKLDHDLQIVADARIALTLSIGAAHSFPDQGIDILLSHADNALYQAKAAGRARMIVWNDVQGQRPLAATA